MTPDTHEILKADTLGRVRIPKQRREIILKEYEQSGLSAAKFAEISGVKYQTFMTWLKKHRGKKTESPTQPLSAPVKWFETILRPGQAPLGTQTKLSVRIFEGISLEISDVAHIELAAALIRAVRKSC